MEVYYLWKIEGEAVFDAFLHLFHPLLSVYAEILKCVWKEVECVVEEIYRLIVVYYGELNGAVVSLVVMLQKIPL